MSLLPNSSPACTACGGGLFSLASAGLPFCRDCQRSHALNDAVQLANDVRALVAGSGVFALLTPGERAGVLASLSTDERLIELAGHPAGDPLVVQAAAGEICRRLGLDGEPMPAERQEIEERWDGMG